jgi:mono/diheme cytochrome c family protein
MKKCELVLLCSMAFACLAAETAMSADTQLIQRGKATFEYWCTPCHGMGRGSRSALLPGTYALQIKYKGTVPALLEDRKDLPAEVLKVFVRRGTWSMPGFRKTEISDDEIVAIAAYLQESSQTPRGVMSNGLHEEGR